MKTKINELVRSQGKTQQEMANLLGISQASFYAYTTGKAEPSLEKLIKLADHFDVSLDFLCGRQNKNIVPLDSLSEPKRQVVQELRTLSDDQALMLLGYIGRIKERPIEEVIAQIKNS